MDVSGCCRFPGVAVSGWFLRVIWVLLLTSRAGEYFKGRKTSRTGGLEEGLGPPGGVALAPRVTERRSIRFGGLREAGTAVIRNG